MGQADRFDDRAPHVLIGWIPARCGACCGWFL